MICFYFLKGSSGQHRLPDIFLNRKPGALMNNFIFRMAHQDNTPWHTAAFKHRHSEPLRFAAQSSNWGEESRFRSFARPVLRGKLRMTAESPVH